MGRGRFALLLRVVDDQDYGFYQCFAESFNMQLFA